MVTRAGVTQHEFTEEFASEEELFSAAFDYGLDLIAQRLIAAVQGQKRWLTRVRMAVVCIARFFDAEPEWAEFLLFSAPSCATSLLERREHVLGRLAQLLECGAPRNTERGVISRSPLTAELVIGGAFSVVQGRMLRHKGMPLVELVPSLMSLIVLPYLGVEQANAELSKKPARERETERQAPELPRRASYRTTLVLKAIASSPRANNRTVAQAAGLADEGQTSKLLSRLRRQGLIENVGLGQAYGEPNAWLLTTEGVRIAQMLGRELPGQTRRVKPGQAAAATPASGAQATQPSHARKRGRGTCQS